PPSDFVQSSLSSPSPVSTPVSLESINPIPTPSPTSCVRQTVADNGNLLPTTSRYVDGYPTRFNNGYSKIMVDNSRNNTDMLVKLYRLDSEFSDPARIIFLESGAQFVFADLEPGKYDLRYKDLSSCQIVRTEELTVNEFETMTSIRASSITVTLYKVMGGNMETYIIDENDF
ncbi:MAG: hypothetical protein ACO4AI_06025, partial [Prochlorothrix sp.]